MGTREDQLTDFWRETRRMGSVSTLHNHSAADLAGIQFSDWDCIDVLDWTGALSAGRLAEHVGMSSGAITGVIDRLERRGFVRRAPDPRDRRKVVVELLRDCHRELGNCFSQLLKDVDELVAAYDDEELALIVDFLRRSNELLATSTERMRAATRAQKQASSTG